MAQQRSTPTSRRTGPIAENVLDLVGGTPLLRLSRIGGRDCADILAKMESFNPAGSVKDRIALSMIEAAEAEGRVRPGDTIVEPTSGNTGIGLAMVAAVKGYRLIVTMPEDMSLERRRLLERYGAELILTPAIEGMSGAVFAAQCLIEEHPEYFMPQQFQNPANPEAHRCTTAREVIEATGGRLDAFVAGVGTGGTITGVGEVLKREIENVWIVAVEPARSPVLSGGKPGIHRLDGIGASFVPQVLNRDILDEIVTIDNEEAFEMTHRLAREEGLLAGVTSGANVLASTRVAARLGVGKTVVTVLPDGGERYLASGQ